MCSSFVHHLEAPILDEQDLSIHLTNGLLMSSVFDHKLEDRVLHEHNPLILLNRHSRTRIHLYAYPSLIQLDHVFLLYEVRVQAAVLSVSGQLFSGTDLGHNIPG
jgi:hypothetical protein